MTVPGGRSVFCLSSYESVSNRRVIRLAGIASKHACLSVSRILDSHESALLCRLIHIPTLLLNGPHPHTQYLGRTSLNCVGEMELCMSMSRGPNPLNCSGEDKHLEEGGRTQKGA
jgi:hypothetical protein